MTFGRVGSEISRINLGANILHVIPLFVFSDYLVTAELTGDSEIFEWNASIMQFECVWNGPSLTDLYPVMIQQDRRDVVLLLEVPHSDNVIDLDVYEVTTIKRKESDFVPRLVFTSMVFMYLNVNLHNINQMFLLVLCNIWKCILNDHDVHNISSLTGKRTCISFVCDVEKSLTKRAEEN